MFVCLYACVSAFASNILYISLYSYTKASYDRERERGLNIMDNTLFNVRTVRANEGERNERRKLDDISQ